MQRHIDELTEADSNVVFCLWVTLDSMISMISRNREHFKKLLWDVGSLGKTSYSKMQRIEKTTGDVTYYTSLVGTGGRLRGQTECGVLQP